MVGISRAADGLSDDNFEKRDPRGHTGFILDPFFLRTEQLQVMEVTHYLS